MNIGKLLNTIGDGIQIIDTLKDDDTEAKLRERIKVLEVALEVEKQRSERLRIKVVARDERLTQVQQRLIEIEQELISEQQQSQ
jgi:hypothetical protein